MIKYEVIIYWSAEDDAFIAEVPEFRDAPRMATRRKAPSATRKTRFASGSTQPKGRCLILA
ncbi:MAG: type II toxin-antitoxin system HicB family antitoxin [Bryobacteraceae bacterium]